MNPKYDIYEEIDRYLNEELSEAELMQFNQKLSADAEFKSLVEAQKIANEVIIDQELIKLKARMSKEMNADNTSSGPWGKIIVISALVVSSAALYTYTHYSSSPDAEESKEITMTAPAPLPTPEEQVEPQSSAKPLLKNKITKQTEKAALTHVNEQADVTPLPELDEAAVSTKENTITILQTPQQETTKQAGEALKELAKVNCETVHISAQVRVDYGFDNDGEATIIIDQVSVKGGTAPYSYAIGQSGFESDTRFDGIKDGVYHVRVKDHNGCVSQVKKEVVVKTPAKEIDEAFAPVHGERWKFPVKANTDANVSIFNKAGSLVYSTTVSGGHPEEWDGKNNAGVELESGNYYFVIQYTARDLVKGHISIVK